MTQSSKRPSAVSPRSVQARRASEWVRTARLQALTRWRVVLVLICSAMFSDGTAWSQQIPIPDQAAQNAALALVNEVYKSDYEAAKTDEQKIAIVRKMLQQGAAIRNDPAGHYVLFRIAHDLAGKAGDVQLAFQAIAEMQKVYQVDALKLKAAVMADAARALRTPEEQQRILSPVSGLIDEAIAKDDYELTKALGDIAIASARKAKDTAVIKRLARRNEEVDGIAAAYAESQTARALLANKPADPSANLTVGKFLCFVKGDWVTGIPMLALGNDNELKPLAVQELDSPADPLALGDGWWSVAESQDEAVGQRIRQHAAHWYKKVLPTLSGLNKAKIEKRISDAVEIAFLVASREVAAYETFRLVPESVERHALAPATANAAPMIEGGHVASPLKNFLNGLSGWKCEGDVSEFRIIDNGAGIFTYGTTKREAARGRLSQTFVVPNDASKLRFELRGGRAKHIFVALKSDGAELKRATGRNSNTPHVLEWEIQALRGKAVEFEIVDGTNGPWQFIGVSKIEVVRAAK